MIEVCCEYLRAQTACPRTTKSFACPKSVRPLPSYQNARRVLLLRLVPLDMQGCGLDNHGHRERMDGIHLFCPLTYGEVESEGSVSHRSGRKKSGFEKLSLN